MAFNFPNSPTLNQQYTFAGKTWQYNGVAWDSLVVPSTLQASLNQLVQATTNHYFLKGDGTNATMSPILDSDLPTTQDLKTLTNVSSTSTVKDSGGTAYTIGYRQMPQISMTGSGTLTLAADAKHIYCNGGTTATITIPASTGVYTVGTVITIVNNHSGVVTVSGTATLQLANGAAGTTRSIATKGMMTLLLVATDLWWCAGAGVT